LIFVLLAATATSCILEEFLVESRFRRNFICVAGSWISYIDLGEKQRDVIVLAHGFLSNAEAWEPQIYALAEHYRVIAPELWGHGKSGPLPKATANLGDIATQNLEFLDLLDIKEFSLAGVSIGGMWAAELAMSHSERIKSLVLLGTSLGEECQVKKDRYSMVLSAMGAAEMMPVSLVEALLPIFLSDETLTYRQDIVRWFQSVLHTIDAPAMDRTLSPLGKMMFGRRDALSDLRAVIQPCLVLTGDQDVSSSVAEGKTMSEVLGCDFCAIPGAGNIPSLEAAEIVSHHLLSFFAEVHAQRPCAGKWFNQPVAV
jgi:pimeloyl-ACP methyl ester carboxylesterase